MKVVVSPMSGCPQIVPDAWGETRFDAAGRPYRYEPLPVCRVPVGHGRTLDQALGLAWRICDTLAEESIS